MLPATKEFSLAMHCLTLCFDMVVECSECLRSVQHSLGDCHCVKLIIKEGLLKNGFVVLNVDGICVQFLQIWTTGGSARIYRQMSSMAFYLIYHPLHYKLSGTNFKYIQGKRRACTLCRQMFLLRVLHWKGGCSAVILPVKVIEMHAFIDVVIA